MAAAHKYLVVFYCATANKTLEDGPMDEDEIVLIVWVVIDVLTNQIVGPCRNVVQPTLTQPDPDHLSELGIDFQDLIKAGNLSETLDQFKQYITTELNPNGNAAVCLCTDGQTTLRQCLFPEVCNKNMELPDCFYTFFDLRKEFKKVYPIVNEITSTKDMAKHLGIDMSSANNNGMVECQIMAAVVQKLIEKGHEFKNPEYISRKLETGPYPKHEIVDNETVVKVRGLPWQSSDQDVAKFFRGLNIVKGGVALCLNAQGRRNGEAIVRFASKEHRDLGLKRHKRHMGSRYIEVYKGTAEDFLKIVADASHEAANFLSRSDGHVIVKMRGLPFSATPKEVLEFFGEDCLVSGGEDGMLFVRYNDGRSTGDAFVLFPTEEIALTALKKHKDMMRERYIELFRSTAAEVTQVIKRYSSLPLIPSGPPPPTAIAQIPILPQHVITSGSVRNCIRLRGLPFAAKVEDIMMFLGEYADAIRPAGIHMVLNQQGRPSGDCFIQMTNETKAAQTAGQCHRKHMGERYVEVFQCSGDEMNFVLMGGTLNRNGLSPPGQPPISPNGAITPPNQYFSAFPTAMQPTGLIGHIPTSAQMPSRVPAPTTYYTTQPMYIPPYFPSPPISPNTGPVYYPAPNFTMAPPDPTAVQLQYGATAGGPACDSYVMYAAAAHAVLEKNLQNLCNTEQQLV